MKKPKITHQKQQVAADILNSFECLMMGHKGELFWLGLTFLGWCLLAALTGGIGNIFLNPYMNAAYAAFYRDQISPKTPVMTYDYVIPQIDNPA